MQMKRGELERSEKWKGKTDQIPNYAPHSSDFLFLALTGLESCSTLEVPYTSHAGLSIIRQTVQGRSGFDADIKA